MKIGIVCYPTYGGSGVVATELGIGLAKRGHEVHFITYKRPARLTTFQENVFYHEVDTDDYPLFEYTPYDTALTSKLVDVVRYENLDLLHVHYAIPHAAVAYMAKKILLTQGRYVPVITTLHGTDITLVGNDRAFAPVVEFSINKSDGVTAVSNSLRQQTYDYFNINKEIEVIYNFIDFDRFRKSNKDHFKMAIAPEGERILIHVSNFRKVKRVEDVVQIFHRVHQHLPSKLLLIGDGPERRNAEELCRELHLCNDIRFLGKQDAIEELMAVADIFLIPSENESFGLAALEAMACEVPVISSNAGGLPEVNIHGQTGFLSDVGNVEEMANYAIQILSNEDVLNRFRENALAQAKRFDIANILPKYEQYYEEILKAAVY
ncbi:MAG: N-acetyl-alpha-D-glucosaminyl L-malate synthase BshA [Haliscomenobacter sp.]|nr:N-acetyl-alpha-D-glucosaminyl L-malate synthase BshA [Haliscomenobacter sp.]MBK8655131.1 N-acetyl-alpha-D-glucosaminyl L-malate synthase BshA [Haliscomenobacter sp.]MBP9075377.1 N-acetyl-alpha-D-glucosaminyl L-malate synthase BshA [Haliscomenobacter sp.]MBP9873099.1 N-acetyl-alpha-D-glucosaminyl L-malate synthase BshA [Haliscomenobacter sp.]